MAKVFDGMYHWERDENTKMAIKKQVLEKYNKREVQGFYQLDGFAVGTGCTDELTDECFVLHTFELMHSSDVRILIKTGTSFEDAIRLMNILMNWLERSPKDFEERMAYIKADGPIEADSNASPL